MHAIRSCAARSGNKVMVHCVAAQQRTPTVAGNLAEIHRYWWPTAAALESTAISRAPESRCSKASCYRDRWRSPTWSRPAETPSGAVEGGPQPGGELTLDGRIRAVPGVLPMVLAARDRGYRVVLVPDSQAKPSPAGALGG